MTEEKKEDWFVDSPLPVKVVPPIKINLKTKRSSMPKVGIIVMGVLVSCSVVAIAVILTTAPAKKNGEPLSSPGKSVPAQPAAPKAKMISPRPAPIMPVKTVDAPAGLTGTVTTEVSGTKLEARPRFGDELVDLEIILPNEQRLFYVCEPRR